MQYLNLQKIGAAATALTFTLAMGATFASPASAQVAGPGVARLGYTSGDVGVRRADANNYLAGAVNAPLLAGDYVATGAGTAEVQMDGRSRVRVAHNTDVRFINLNQGHREMQLAQGTVDQRLFGGVGGAAQIDTPALTVRPVRSGSYRATVLGNGETRITVRSGRVKIFTHRGSFYLAPGSTLVADGSIDDPRTRYIGPIGYDSFDRWNGARDVAVEQALAADAYVNPAIAYDDFSNAGTWVDDSSYGRVWYPDDVAANWAPYSDGQWVWEDGYGWTWVDDDSWGWTPFHYGRWYYSNDYNRWCWYPPAYAVDPVWAPALVGWLSFDIGNVSIGLGYGDVGWVPLAPYEAYDPWYGWYGGVFEPATTVAFVDFGDPAQIGGRYRNARYRGGITAVSYDRFQNGQFSDPAHPALNAIRDPRGVRGIAPVVPTQNNLRFGNRSVSRSLASRSFPQRSFAGSAAPAQHRTAFSQQRQQLATHLAPALGRLRAAQSRPQAANGQRRAQATVGQHGSRTANAAQNPHGAAWNRFNNARNGSANVANGQQQHRNVASQQRNAPAQHAMTQQHAGVQRSAQTSHQPAAQSYRQAAVPHRQPAMQAPREPSMVSHRLPATQYQRPAVQSYHPPAQSHYAPAQTYRAPAQTYRAPAQTHYAPAQTYRAPAQPRQAAPAARPAGGQQGGGHPAPQGGNPNRRPGS